MTTPQKAPFIRDWHAINLMAYVKADASICPLCSGWKSTKMLVCDHCFHVYGDEALRLVKMEIGRLIPGLWYSLTGLNLIGNGGNGNHKKKEKRKKTEGPVLLKEIEKTEQLPKIKKVTESKGFPESKGSDGKCLLQEFVLPEVKEKPKTESLSVDMPFENEEKTEGMPEDENVYEIRGIRVFRDLMNLVAFGSFKERGYCPICRNEKYPMDWICRRCQSVYGSGGIKAVRRESVRINPEKKFRHALPEQVFQSLVEKARRLIFSDAGELFCKTPHSLALTISSLNGIPKGIPFPVFVSAAGVAIDEGTQKSEMTSGKAAVDFSGDLEVEKIRFMLGGIKQNLREDVQVVKTFCKFLIQKFESWAIKRKEKGGKATKAIFLQEVGFSYNAFLLFTKNPVNQGLSKKKALQLIDKLEDLFVREGLR